MNWYFGAAAILTVVIGIVHSVLGEKMIFSRMRTGGLIPTNGGKVLPEPFVRILWATWHIVTVMGWGLAWFLFWLASPDSPHSIAQPLSIMLAATMGISSLLVLVGTKGRHPGWAGLLLVSILVALGRF